MELRPYQNLAIAHTLRATTQGDRRVYFTLPTGTGKTVVLSKLTRPFDRVLVVAHRNELIDQLADRLRADWGHATVGVVKAERNEAAARLVVGTPQTLRPERVRGITCYGAIDAMLIDEAHHATTGTRYASIIDLLAETQPNVSVIGCTATPFRNDKQRMQDLLPICAFSRSIDDMQREGYLCPLVWKRIRVGFDLSQVKLVTTVEGADFDPEALRIQAEDGDAVDVIVAATIRLIDQRPTAVFAVSIRHAQMLADAYRTAGVSAAAIWGAMPKDERAEVLARWRSGDIQVVANCQVLTEGFDFPAIGAVIVARPTRSQSLYVQCVGRGTRVHPGKSDCLVIDVSGNEPISECRQVLLPDITSIDATSEDEEEQGADENADRKAPKHVSTRPRSLVRNPDFDVVYRWIRDDDCFCIAAQRDTMVVLMADPDGSGLYRVGALRNDGYARLLSARTDHVRQHQERAAKWLETKGLTPLTKRGQRWHDDPATPQQLQLLGRLSPELLMELEAPSKREVSEAITRAVLRRRLSQLRDVLWSERLAVVA